VVPRGALPAPTDQASAEAGAHGLALDLHWNAELGVAGQLPGPPAYGAAGFQAGVRARQDAWGVLVLAQLGLPMRASLGPSEVQVPPPSCFTCARMSRKTSAATQVPIAK